MSQDPVEPRDESPEPEPRKKRSFWAELPILVLVALAVAILIKTFLVQAFYIPSLSMIPTLEVGDRVLVSKISYELGEVERGDVVVFDSPFSSNDERESFLELARRTIMESLGLKLAATQDFIKRVIAVEGDVIEIRSGNLYVNGQPLAEPYLADGADMADFGPETVPVGTVFVMGDNRARSQDSRRFGPIEVSSIIGRAFARVWPIDRIGGL
ncbi:MAG: signal peptidase I [Acidimicrobiia bacterium]